MNNAGKISRAKLIIIAVTVGISLIILIGTSVYSYFLKSSSYHQNADRRWSSEGGITHISCFFTSGYEYKKEKGMELKTKAMNALKEAGSISEDNLNRQIVDCVSIQGKISIQGDKGNLETNAFGTDGDFFLFHPIKILNGSYYSGSDIMQDGIIIDTELAWKLYGSNDVVGKPIIINNQPHYIKAVFKKEENKVAKIAGLDKSMCYISLTSLLANGTVTGSYCYEMLLPNPISGFGLQTMQKNIELEEHEVSIIENSTRYDIIPLLKVIKNWDYRVMSNKAIIYPYWENEARTVENILARLLMIRIVIILLYILIIAILLRRYWVRYRVKIKDTIKNTIVDKIDDIREKRITKSRAKEASIKSEQD